MRQFRRLLLFMLIAALLCAGVTSCQQQVKPTEVQWKNLTWAVGAPLPEASDFVQTLPEGCSVRFAEEYTFSALGEYTLRLILTDAKGRETEHQSRFTLVDDKEPPTIVGAKDLTVYVGDGVSYRAGVSMTDNCDNKVTLTVDSSAVNTAEEGSYPVIYTATDAAGNIATVSVSVYVYRERVTEEMLWEQIDRLIAAHIPTSGTKEQQARAVYDYVYYAIAYDDHSDKNDWVRAAYEGLRTGQGDCYTYFAISKAFFGRLGIENKDIQRTEGIVTERHYWNLVNIGTPTAPRWYHFDACRLRGEAPPFGCLLTDTQINAFSRQKTDADGVSSYFYAYNASAYPASDSTVITPTKYD